ncbi:MAG: hypothetical protein O2782_23210 [bacterium]|nr:hypothetical protein [bacterium]
MKATLPSPRPRWDSSWPVRLALVTILWANSATSAGALEPMASTEVIAVEGTEVVLGAGRLSGLAVASQVTLLRESEPIIHPLTGEVLGVPQEPVGTVHIFEVSDHRSRGGLVKTYSTPRPGDMAEFQPVRAAATMAREVSSVMQEMEALKATLEMVREHDDDMRSYPAFARKVWDEVAAMCSYLTSIDQRLVEIEEQQSEDHFRLSSVLSGEHHQQDYKEFTVRYAPDTEVRLRAAGKTLLIEVVGDSLHMQEMAAPVSMAPPRQQSESPGLLAMLGFGKKADVDTGDSAADDDKPYEVEVTDLTMTDEAPWYSSIYHLAAGIGLTMAMLIMVVLVIKKRYSDVMDGLEEFDDEYDKYLEDEDELEDEDDDDDGK